jgi:hypothetical protein
MKSGELQTRSRAEYIAEIEDQSTTVRITEIGPQLRGEPTRVSIEEIRKNRDAHRQ